MTTAPSEDRRKGRRTRRTHGYERPLGEWNRYEIIVDGERITLKVNGETVNVATSSTVRPGPVALQSEGASIQFRNIRVAPIVSR